MDKLKTVKSIPLKFGIDEILNIHEDERQRPTSAFAGEQQDDHSYGDDVKKDIAHIYGLTAYDQYDSMRPIGPQMPSIVQRVPLSVSFRKDASADQTADNPTVAIRSGKRKKSWTRAVFSSLQRKGLERSFTAQQYISKKDRRKLAATLGLSDAQLNKLSAEMDDNDGRSLAPVIVAETMLGL
ncbi:hypothetical protein RvY_09423 [Ramazzottius varieornatus]|uniref:Homeobox domain-containing protein n=1 Tax=Ramazzottius varieornatus TaxID=947166 RepID=A0A1D1V9A1_RAMVA|nr:hypothetical protein RvY_09423 [Ramazzottius varieornatus]